MPAAYIVVQEAADASELAAHIQAAAAQPTAQRNQADLADNHVSMLLITHTDEITDDQT